jgi:hypothetical protein
VENAEDEDGLNELAKLAAIPGIDQAQVDAVIKLARLAKHVPVPHKQGNEAMINVVLTVVIGVSLAGLLALFGVVYFQNERITRLEGTVEMQGKAATELQSRVVKLEEAVDGLVLIR